MMYVHVDAGNNMKFVETPWIHYALSGKYDYIILNRGAHYLPTTLVNEQLELLIPFLHDIMNKFSKTQIFYRNTVSGHPKCSDFDKPLQLEDNYNRYVMHAFNSPEVRDFNWGKFPLQNKIITKAFESINAIIIDVNASAYFRPDSHSRPNGDCLHYCLPGPVDNWVILFYNILLKYKDYCEPKAFRNTTHI